MTQGDSDGDGDGDDEGDLQGDISCSSLHRRPYLLQRVEGSHVGVHTPGRGDGGGRGKGLGDG